MDEKRVEFVTVVCERTVPQPLHEFVPIGCVEDLAERFDLRGVWHRVVCERELVQIVITEDR
jgi:hypothetical protein